MTTTISNDYIADQFNLLGKLMDIHGENSFKTRSYSSAAFAIEKLPGQLADLPPEKFVSIKGIGDAIGKKITQLLETGELPLLREYMEKTPSGVLEMLQIKGLGPKKIATIWKEMGVESIGELLYACQENRLLLYKGFGEKTQTNVRETIEFYLKSQGSHLYAEIEAVANLIDTTLAKAFPGEQFLLTGEFRRQLPIIDRLEWVTTAAADQVRTYFVNQGYQAEDGALHERHNTLLFKSPEGLLINTYHPEPGYFQAVLFRTSCSSEFMTEWSGRTGRSYLDEFQPDYANEQAIFTEAAIHFIPSPAREQMHIIDRAREPLPAPIQPSDVRAVIHSHSKWSDGSNTLEEMAKACIEKGYEYLVISDHSKSAFYANGLSEERIREQHREIDELNARLAPFVIFKSIECDILNDGLLDYSDTILSTFDLVIASVHSNLKMTEEKAMHRLLRAIANPYTTILGHMTGRLLLSRPGYPVDHRLIIEACAAHQVTIELNAHPRRLDMDWKWIEYAVKQGVLISIDPDAHTIAGYKDIRYGVLAAQKAGLTAAQNLSSYSLEQFRGFLAERKKARGI
jgi:DNA polymerase (family 10)